MNKIKNEMKETLEIVKQNIWSTLFAALFGLSVGHNIKQYRIIESNKEYINDIQNVLHKNIEANDLLLNAFTSSIVIIKNDSITVPKKFKIDSNKALDKLIQSNKNIIKFNKKYK